MIDVDFLPRVKNPPKEDKISPGETISCETYISLHVPQMKIPDGLDWYENNQKLDLDSIKEPLTYNVTKISSSVSFNQIRNHTANLTCCTTFKVERLECVLVQKSTIVVTTQASTKLTSVINSIVLSSNQDSTTKITQSSNHPSTERAEVTSATIQTTKLFNKTVAIGCNTLLIILFSFIFSRVFGN